MSLKLKINEPVQIALTRTDAKYFDSKFPNRPGSLMYSVVLLADGTEDKLFLDDDAIPDALKNMGAHTPFTICAQKGKGGGMYYVVRSAGAPAPAASTPFDELPSDLERKLEASIPYVQAQKARQAASQAKPAAQPGPVVVSAKQTNPTPSATATISGTGLSQLLAGCGVAVIDGYLAIRDYAASKGIDLVEFRDQGINLQDLISTVVIHTQKMAELECKYGVKEAMISAKYGVTEATISARNGGIQ